MTGSLVRPSLFASIFAPLCFAPLFAIAQSAPSGPQTRIRTTADLVVVDVTVNNSRQDPVHLLKPSDFTIFEDGRLQTIKIFEEHSASKAGPLPPALRLEPGTFTNYSPVPAHSTLYILLFDKLNTPMMAQAEVRDQVLKFLKEARPGRRMAIFSLTTELKLLQGFTSDPEVLRALVAGKKGNPGASPLINDAVSGNGSGADDKLLETAGVALSNSPDGKTTPANLQRFVGEEQSVKLQLRARYTLDAFNLLARYMSGLPGRKNLIWFSGSFPINIFPDPDSQHPSAGFSSAEDELRQTADLLAQNQVAVYPIDVRGLMAAPTMEASNTSLIVSGPNFDESTLLTIEYHNTMNQLAEATGGKATYNRNRLNKSIEKAIEDGSNYYTLAYAPTNREWNGRYRKIQVKVDRRGVALAYRRGYYADDLRADKRHDEQNVKPDIAPYSVIEAAMRRGAPDLAEIVFAADVRPSTSASGSELAPGNQAGGRITGPFRRYTVHFKILPGQVSCPATPDGVHHCLLHLLTFVYDAGGALVNRQATSAGVDIPALEYADLSHRFFGRDSAD
jgi:VWFA-related protein